MISSTAKFIIGCKIQPKVVRIGADTGNVLTPACKNGIKSTEVMVLKLDPIFSSNMVFAAGLPIRIYGTGQGKGKVIFAGKSKSFVSEKDTWILEFSPMDFGGPYELKAVFDDTEVLLKDIYIGKVLLCAGQSNMQFKISEAHVPEQLLRSNQKLRMFATHRLEKERFSTKDGWIKADKENIGDWSAIGYLVGNGISEKEDIAVGIICCYQGASMIESWVPQGIFKAEGIAVPDDKKHHDFHIEPYSFWNRDGFLYDYAFSQVVPFSVSAVIWYQGESNTSTEGGKAYRRMMERLIQVWRGDFGNDRLPFVIVQIADYTPSLNEGWRLVQKAQLDVQNTTAKVKTVISADVCEKDDIHPPTKHLLAGRIADALSLLLN